jgi:hypothetical protein
MPYASINAAEDAILTLFKTAWDQVSPPVPAVYDNVAQEAPRAGTTWVRVQIKHNPGAGGQTTIGGAPGAKRFTRYGHVVCELFVPTGKGKSAYTNLTDTLLAIFEGKTASFGGAFFYNVRPSEVGQDCDWFQVNVLAEFQWDQIR